jgi:hypothetical protein
MMPDLTDEEYDALDEYYTKNPPKVDPAKRGGFFTRQRELLEPQPSLEGEGSPLAVLHCRKCGIFEERGPLWQS